MNLFLTAKPRTGKSTAIKKIVSEIGKDKCVGFITEEIKEEGKRVGFKIITMDGREGVLASITTISDVRLSRYGIDIKTFEDLCISTISNIEDSNKIIIIDEVGPIQMFSERFKKALIEALGNSNDIIGTVFFDQHPWIDGFKEIEGVKLINVTVENRDEIPNMILTALR